MKRLETRRREPFVVIGLIITLFFIWSSGYYAPTFQTADISIPRCIVSNGITDNTNIINNTSGDLTSDEQRERAGKEVQAVLMKEETRYPQDLRVTWMGEEGEGEGESEGQSLMPESKLLRHATGWTIIDNLYMLNGTLFIVTSDPYAWPKREAMTSSGYEKYPGAEEAAKRKPTDKDMRIVTPEEARTIFASGSTGGSRSASRGVETQFAIKLDGVTFHVNDPKQFLGHYFHWSAEVLFGLWRIYASLDPTITPDGLTTLPPPKRLLFPHTTGSGWRDYARMNTWVTHAAFPSLSLEFADEVFKDRKETGRVYVFERAVLGDRAAAGESEAFGRSWRIVGSVVEDVEASEGWWAPVRRSVLEFSGVPREWILGPPSTYPSSAFSSGFGAGAGVGVSDPAMRKRNSELVITYISRQDWGRRMLRPADHEKLVQELEALRDRYGYEVNVVDMQDLTRAEQFSLAARTTIMMGVHGNGLTALLWMRPTPRSTVIEFFFPTGFAFDYQYTAHALGIKHYGVWNDVTFTQPDIPKRPNYPEGFQGNDIPLDGAVVARLVESRLNLREPDSEPENETESGENVHRDDSEDVR